MRPTSKYLLYTAYGLLMLAVFLYLRFPSDLAKRLLLEAVKKADPEIVLTTESVALVPPVGIRLDAPALAYANIPVLRMDHFKVNPQLLSLVRKRKDYSISGAMGDGQLTGRIESDTASARPQTIAVVSMERIQFDYIELLNQWPSFLVDGLLDAIVKYDSTKVGGTADISAEIRPVKIAFEDPLMGIEALEFSSIDTQLTMTPRMIQIRNCEAAGNQLDARLTGTLVFRQPMDNSRINLSLTVKPQPAFIEDHKNDVIGGLLASDSARKRGIAFRISGTIANPRYIIR